MKVTRAPLALLVLLLLFPVAAARAQVTQDSFQTEMMTRLRAILPGAQVTPQVDDPLALTITGGDADGVQINLHRIFGYCQQATAADCEAEKAQFLTAVTEIRRAPATRESLRVIVRDAQYVDSLREYAGRGPGKPDTVLVRPLGGDLFAIVVSDSPNALMMMTEMGVKELDLTSGQAWEIAQRQTAPLLPAMPTAAQLATGAIVYEGHEFGGSLLVDLPAWTSLAAEVGPDLFITVVSDRIVFVATMPAGPNLESFKRTVEEDCAAQPRCISPNIYRFRDGRWAIAE